jgi:hypothetical protein
MRSSIQSDMRQDLEKTLAILRQPRFREDPDNPSLPVPAPFAGEQDLEPSLPERTLPSRPLRANSRRMPEARWLVGVSVLVILGITLAGLTMFRARLNPVQTSPVTSSASNNPTQALSTNDEARRGLVVLTNSSDVLAVSNASPVLFSAPVVASAPARAPASPPAPGAESPDESVVAGSGVLALSSPTTADIYKDGVYLGSVPVSLEIPAGTHTLEYRHGNLRRNMTHVINSNETTRAMITFDVSVQINSKPWADVFIDGIERRALGQTPLSGLQVPIGSVLIFENPQFQPKRYRVTGNETGIQVVFP